MDRGFSNSSIVLRGLLGFVLIFGLLGLASAAHASTSTWYAQFQTDNFYIEVYNGNSWVSMNQPYTYYYDDWYFFEHPYRYDYGGTVYTFEPGWYNYEPYWYYSPYSYDYYPVDYYYYGGWNYEPYWYHTPGYGSYYSGYYPSEYPWYPPYGYGPGYSYNYGYGYGQGYPYRVIPGADFGDFGGYDYPQLAECGELDIKIDSLRVNPGNSEVSEITIKNRSGMNFEIKSVNIWIDSFDLDKEILKYTKTIKANKTGEIPFQISAEEDADYDSVRAVVKLTGQFADGTYCSVSDIGEREFSIMIGSGGSHNTYNYEPNNDWAYSTSNQGNSNPASGNQGWQEVEHYETAPQEDAEEAVLPISFSGPENCYGLDLEAHNITVNSGSSNTTQFILRNYTSGDFYIDNVSAYDYSDDFYVSAAANHDFVFGESFAGIQVTAYGNNGVIDDYGTAHIEVQGHFDNGLACTIGPENFYVYVNGEVTDRCELFNITVDNKVEINGAGVVRFAVDNPLENDVVINIEGQNVDIDLRQVVVAAETYAERIVYVSNLTSHTGWVVYTIDAGECNFLQKATVVKHFEGEAPPLPVEGSVEVVSYAYSSEIVDLLDLPLTLRNGSSAVKFADVSVVDLPNGFSAEALEVELLSGETKTVYLAIGVDENVALGSYGAKLKIDVDGEVTIKDVVFEVVSGEAAEEENTEENAGFESLLSTAFIVFGDNAISIGILLLAVILIYILYKFAITKKSQGNHPPFEHN